MPALLSGNESTRRTGTGPFEMSKKNNPVQKSQRDRTLSDSSLTAADLSGPKRPNNISTTKLLKFLLNISVSTFEETHQIKDRVETLQLSYNEIKTLLSKNIQLKEEERIRRRERAY